MTAHLFEDGGFGQVIHLAAQPGVRYSLVNPRAYIGANIDALTKAWAEAGRNGAPDIRILIAFKPDPADLAAWAGAGATELIWGVPDRSPADVLASLDRLANRLNSESAPVSP